MSRFRMTVLLALFLACAPPAIAGTETYEVDQVHSRIMFNVRHFVSLFNGRFNGVKGEIVLDRENLATAKIAVEIDAASIDTGAEKRDTHLKGPEFFDVAAHASITFQSTEVIPMPESKAIVKGNLTMHGVTKPVEMEAQVLGFGPDTWGGFRAGFLGRTKLNRSEYGISYDKKGPDGAPVLGDEVEIVLNIEAIRKEPEKPAPPSSGK